MHAIIYNKDDKRHPKRKAATDLTPEEKRSIEDQQKLFKGYNRARAEQL